MIFRYQQPIASIDDITTTIGVDYVTKDVAIDNEKVKLRVGCFVEWISNYSVLVKNVLQR